MWIKQYRSHDPGICLCWAFCFEDVLLASSPLIRGIFPGSLWNSEETSVWPPESQSKNKRNGLRSVVSRRRCATPSAWIKSRAALPVNSGVELTVVWWCGLYSGAYTQPSHWGVVYQRAMICVTHLELTHSAVMGAPALIKPDVLGLEFFFWSHGSSLHFCSSDWVWTMLLLLIYILHFFSSVTQSHREPLACPGCRANKHCRDTGVAVVRYSLMRLCGIRRWRFHCDWMRLTLILIVCMF